MREQSEYSDVTLISKEGEKFPAHRLILSVTSSHLRVGDCNEESQDGGDFGERERGRERVEREKLYETTTGRGRR